MRRTLASARLFASLVLAASTDSLVASEERFGFAQREHDIESGLVHMRQRMYDPRTGRFTQVDPLLGTLIDPYSYGSNDPLRYRDPMGLDVTGADQASHAHYQSRLRQLKREGQGELYHLVYNDWLRMTNELVASQGFWETTDTQTALGLLRDVQATAPYLTATDALSNPAQLQADLTLGASVNDTLTGTIGDLETYHTTVLWVDRGTTVVSLAAGAGALTSLSRFGLQAGGKEMGKLLLKEGGKAVVATTAVEGGVWAAEELGADPETTAMLRTLGCGALRIKGLVSGAALSSLRRSYTDEVAKLSTIRDLLTWRGQSREAIARELVVLRNSLRREFQDATPESLRTLIRARNLNRYGDPVGPTVQWQLDRGKSWDEIIEGALQPGW